MNKKILLMFKETYSMTFNNGFKKTQEQQRLNGVNGDYLGFVEPRILTHKKSNK